MSHRWLTPDPAQDHINPYIFANNNPLSYTDHYGYSASTLSPNPLLRDEKKALDNLLKRMDPDIPYLPFTDALNAEIHRDPTGFYQLQPDAKTLPNILFGNGITTTLAEAMEHAQKISLLTGKQSNIGICYQATRGSGGDVWDAKADRKLKYPTECGSVMLNYAREFFKREKGNLMLIVHSRGAINARSMLPYLSEKERLRLFIVAVAPASYILEELCGDINHLISQGDGWVKYVFTELEGNEKLKKEAHDPTVHYLEPHSTKNGWSQEHSFKNPVYDEKLKYSLEEFNKKNNP
jgi:hypothetical protein